MLINVDKFDEDLKGLLDDKSGATPHAITHLYLSRPWPNLRKGVLKRRPKETDNTLKNGNVIITSYQPQGEEQAQLLDLVIYDIPAKWDNYILLANLGQWGKVISVILTLGTQLWNDKRISWCHYSTPNFKNLCISAQIGNADKSSRTPKGFNFSFSGSNTNNHKNNQNKPPKSGRSPKKITLSRTGQSFKSDVKHLIAGLKALLEHYI
ncbi:hypothetical protein RclHR1_07370004 [Rhizophagus clarus]|uniref:Uncharacterized protein n=1 Tax=Rhizophagus clarus TaxID=94130 RepID=A0A2Z6S8K1_9GLOM|nr:hypothetical protein RclHR1_07370004 [Rhizophagus clarus]